MGVETMLLVVCFKIILRADYHTYTDLLSLKNKMGCLNSYTYEYYTGYRRWQDDEME